MVNIRPDKVKKILTVKPNALSILETSAQQNNILENFIESLRKQYVRVYNTRTKKTNYAIGMCNNYMITVAHIMEKASDEITVCSNGKTYRSAVVKVNRSRDLMFLRVVDREFPPFKDIKKHLISDLKYDDITAAYYCRPTEKPLIYGCTLNYIRKMRTPITIPKDEDFCFSDGVIRVEFMRVKDTCNIIKAGDCGMPLIAVQDNKMRIIGLHNALGASADALFSAISIEDYNALSYTTNSGDYEVVRHLKDDSLYTTIPFYAKGLKDIQQSRYERLGLPVIGYSSSLFTVSKPTFKKRKITIPNAKTTCNYLPAALSIKDVSDYSLLTADNNGQYKPLFSQSMKYMIKTDTYGQWDEEIRQVTKNLITTKYKTRYDTPKNMNLHNILNGEAGTANNPFELDTSAGPYFKIRYNILTKEGLLENIAPAANVPYYRVKQNQHGDDLLQQYNSYIQSIEDGIPVLMVTKDNAKVELLPDYKVRQGKVRLFSELDFAFNMMLKHYFGHFITSVLNNHRDNDYKMGYNPYVEASEIMLKLNTIKGPVISTDISGCDKSMPKELIEDFVDCVLYNQTTKVRKALAKSLIYSIHIMDGHIYALNCGNESGSYLTTILNCFAMEVITIYPIVIAFHNKYKRYPLLADLQYVYQCVYLGDDRAMKISETLNLDFHDLQESAKLFNFNVTVAKVESNEVSFCSRVFRKSPYHPLIYIPALKKESIIASIHYYVAETNSMISQNINMALFEASLHPEEFFNDVLHDAIQLIRKYNLDQLCDMLSYEEYNMVFHRYVAGDFNKPALMVLDNQDTLKLYKNFQTNSKQILNFTKKKNILIMDAISWLNNYMQNNGRVNYSEQYSSSGGDECPSWTCVLTYLDQKVTSVSGTKKKAKESASELLRSCLKAGNEQKIHKNSYKPNTGDMPVEPASMNQAATAAQTARLPAAANPQPTHISPAMTTTGEDVMACLQNTVPQTLNPIGAPNMLAVGGIEFDIKDLIYTQFLDCDTEFQITDDKPSGTVVLQIPYGCNTQFNSEYVKNYAKLHGRIAGSIQYRMTVIGNQLFSGALGVAWSPTKITTSTVKISRMQKYAYSAKGLQYMWNDIMYLHDARQTQFWRDVDTDTTNYDDRPHLVVFLMMSIQNPLKEGAITRIRIASKLSGALEQNPFVFSNPVEITAPTIQQFNTISLAQPTQFSTMVQTFPQILSYNMNIYTDGVYACPQLHSATNYYALWEDNKLDKIGYNSFGAPGQYDNTLIQQITKNRATVKANWNLPTEAGEMTMSWWTNMPAVNWRSLQDIFLNIYSEDDQVFASAAQFEGYLRAVAIFSNNTRVDQAHIMTIAKYVPVAGTALSAGGYKIVTDCGIIYISTYAYDSLASFISQYTTTSYPRFNYEYQDSIVLYNSGRVNALPSGYNVLKMTEQPPSSVSTGQYYVTSRDNDTILRYFIAAANGLDINTCYQFDLMDTISQSRVMTVRFLQEYNIFVINQPFTSKYTVCPIQMQQLDIINLNIVPRTNSFPVSDVTNWVDRQSTTYARAFKDKEMTERMSKIGQMEPMKINKAQLREIISSDDLDLESRLLLSEYKTNTSLAIGALGGALGGIGQAIGKNQEYNFAEKQQKNQFQHNLEYQGNMLEAQQKYQKNDQEFQSMMNKTNFGQQKEMASINTQNSLAMKGFNVPISNVTKNSSYA